ncbi:hypothetical protein JOQ06_017921, partial [Pogonophryne albipinna]
SLERLAWLSWETGCSSLVLQRVAIVLKHDSAFNGYCSHSSHLALVGEKRLGEAFFEAMWSVAACLTLMDEIWAEDREKRGERLIEVDPTPIRQLVFVSSRRQMDRAYHPVQRCHLCCQRLGLLDLSAQAV